MTERESTTALLAKSGADSTVGHAPISAHLPHTARTAFQWQYIHSPAYDWIFFLAPFWVSILYWLSISLLPSYDMVMFFAVYILLQETHFGSTWMIYLDPENRQYYQSEKWVYYYVPGLIILACVSISYFISFKTVLFISALFSAIHVARQSTGIVALYRGKAGDSDPKRREYDNLCIYFASAAFLSLGFMRFYLNPGTMLLPISTEVLRALTVGAQIAMAGAFIGAICCLFAVLRMERQNLLNGKPVSLSRLLVFAYSLLLYSPYVFATRLEHAIAMAVGIHYLQYLGIVWWLNRNKYQKTSESGWGLRMLGLLSQSLWARIPYLLVYALLMFAIRQQGFDDWKTWNPKSWLYSLPVALQICHYHLDAFIWRFSNPYIRKTVLKYLRA